MLVLAGTPAGCAAALAAARAGADVLLLEPTSTLGGNLSNGVAAFDCVDPAIVTGVAAELAALVSDHYDGAEDPIVLSRADPVWENDVSARAWMQLLAAEPRITVVRGAVPVGAIREGSRVTEVHWQVAATPSGDPDCDADVQIARARYVIDASYEGDLLEWADIPFDLGREGRSEREPHAGKIFTSDSASGPDGVPPHSVLPGRTGEPDERIMAFAARLVCRWYEDDSVPAAHLIPAPDGYDPRRYKWAPVQAESSGSERWFPGIHLLPGGKMLLNRTEFGNELAGPAAHYVRAHPRERSELRRLFVDHALGFLHFIQTEGGCSTLGLADDEFVDNGGIPRRLYVREGRRLRGVVRVDETDLSPFLSGDGTRPALRIDAIAVGDWPIESRRCRDDAEDGYPRAEGWFFDRIGRAPHQIPWGALLAPGVDNVIVAGGISASHLAAGAVRVESTRVKIGTAAGMGAAMALAGGTSIHDIELSRLQEQLVRGGHPLIHFSDLTPSHPSFADAQRAALRGYVPQDLSYRFEPDRSVSWDEFIRALAIAFAVPVSVTGAHFRDVPRTHDLFVPLESVFDLGTRAGIDIFGYRALEQRTAVERLVDDGRACLTLGPDSAVPAATAQQVIRDVARSAGRRTAVVDLVGLLTRADLARTVASIYS